MTTNIILWIEVFIFIMCCLNIIKNTYNIIKVMWTHSGKVDIDNVGIILFGASISYILSTLIIGF